MKASGAAGGRGFTLVELVVTLMLAGILAAVVLPRMDLVKSLDGPAFRDQLKAALQFARQAAMAARRHICVRVADNAAEFTLHEVEPDTFSGGFACRQVLALPVPGRDCQPQAPNRLCAPAGVGLALGGGVTQFAFDPAGRPVLPLDGSDLAAALQLAVTSGGETLTLSVEAETGLVR